MEGANSVSRREVLGLLAAGGVGVAVTGCGRNSDTTEGGRATTTTTIEDPRVELEQLIVELSANIETSLQLTPESLQRWADAGNTWSTAYSPEAMALPGTSGARPVFWDGPYLPTETVFDLPNQGPPRLLYPERGGLLEMVPHLGPTLIYTPAFMQEEFGRSTRVGHLTTMAVNHVIEAPLVDSSRGTVVVEFATVAPQFGEPVTLIGIANIHDPEEPRLNRPRSQFLAGMSAISQSVNRDEIDPAGSGAWERVEQSQFLTMLGEQSQRPILVRIFDEGWYAEPITAIGDGDVRIPGVPFVTATQWSRYQAILDALLVQDAPAYSAAADEAVDAGLAISPRVRNVAARVREILGGLTDLDAAFDRLPLFQIGFTDLASPVDFI